MRCRNGGESQYLVISGRNKERDACLACQPRANRANLAPAAAAARALKQLKIYRKVRSLGYIFHVIYLQRVVVYVYMSKVSV